MDVTSAPRSRSLSPDPPRRTTDNARDAFNRIREQADKAKDIGADAFRCCCPAHDDRSPSLEVKHDVDRVLLHCWTGCATADVLDLFGLTFADLYDPDPDRGDRSNGRTISKPAPAPSADRAAEVREMLAEARAAEAEKLPVPVEGVWSAVDALRRGEGTPALHVAQLRAVAKGEEWTRLEEWERAAVVEWAAKHAPRFRGGVAAALGTTDREGTHRPAAPPAVPETPLPATFEAMPDEEHAKAIAHDVWYAGRLGLIHGPAGGGKSTLMALAAAAVTRGELFAGRSTAPGKLLICTEDAATWREVMAGAGADLALVSECRWRDLEARVREEAPVAVAVDTMQFVSHQAGSGELDSADAVDGILRPLQALARETGVAITIADHEPWAEGTSGDRETGTKDRPRHSGAKVATADFVLRCTATKDDEGLIVTPEVGPSKAKGARRGITVSRESIDLHGAAVTPPSGGGGGLRPEPSPEAIRDLFEKAQPGTWISRSRLCGRGGRQFEAWQRALDVLVESGAVEHRQTTHGRVAWHEYKLLPQLLPEAPEALPEAPEVTSTPIPIGVAPPPVGGAPEAVSAGPGNNRPEEATMKLEKNPALDTLGGMFPRFTFNGHEPEPEPGTCTPRRSIPIRLDVFADLHEQAGVETERQLLDRDWCIYGPDNKLLATRGLGPAERDARRPELFRAILESLEAAA